jgi:hypothetical protein
MKFKTPLFYDKEGNVIAWFESEIPAELIAQLRWQWAHQIKNSPVTFRTPIFDDEKKEDD